MTTRRWFRGYGLYAVVVLIGILLLANTYLIYKNSQVIEFNKAQQEEAERVKVNTVDVLRNLHFFDMSIRSYAIMPKERFDESTVTGIESNRQLFEALEKSLNHQHFPMERLRVFRDSAMIYFNTVMEMRKDLKKGNIEIMVKFLNEDPGYQVWLSYNTFANRVNVFEDQIAQDAKKNYERALQYSYLLQLLLFLITMPTLGYTAYYTLQSLKLTSKLLKSEAEHNKILSSQNELLEQKVEERTNEILKQTQEISAQNEEISSHNEQLLIQQKEIESQHQALTLHLQELAHAKQIIEDQNKLILQKNNELVDEVAHQTEDLMRTNSALMDQNSRLQQFAYIISHNLRAPLARLIGLTNIIEQSSNPKDTSSIKNMMVTSAHSIDEVIKDLAFILEIQKQNTQVLAPIDVNEIIAKVNHMLEGEIAKTQSKIVINIQNTITIQGLHQYVESIFYNLISNAIKYRDPERKMEIVIRSIQSEEYTIIEVTDNGLGIDLEKYNDKIFMIYKRFHSHVEGKGLGLYLVKTQIMAMGGKIDVSSKPKAGSTFTIYFKK